MRRALILLVFPLLISCPASGGGEKAPAAAAKADADGPVLARVGDEAITFRFFKDMHERMKASPVYRGKAALLDQYIDAILLSREADARNVPESRLSQGMVPRQTRAFYREFLERCGRPLEKLKAEWPAKTLASAEEVMQALESLRGPLGVARKGAIERSPAGRLAVVEVGGRNYDLADLAAFFNEQEWADFTTGGPAARARMLERFVEARLVELGYEKYKSADEPFAEECLARIREKYRAQDLLTSMGLTEEGKEAPPPEITDAEIEAYYSAHKGDFTRPKSARALHIRVKTQPEADALKKRLDEGADFAELARQYSLDPDGKSGGDWGEIRFGLEMKPPKSYAFLLPPGQTAAYWIADGHCEVIRTLSVERENLPLSDPGVRYDVRFRLAAEKRKENLHSLVRRLRTETHIEVNRSLMDQLK